MNPADFIVKCYPQDINWGQADSYVFIVKHRPTGLEAKAAGQRAEQARIMAWNQMTTILKEYNANNI